MLTTLVQVKPSLFFLWTGEWVIHSLRSLVVAWIYKSLKIDEMYIYLANKDDFSKVPEALLQRFGDPQFVMTIKLDKREKLARVDINVVRNAISDDGFFLQMPPNKNAPIIENSKTLH